MPLIIIELSLQLTIHTNKIIPPIKKTKLNIPCVKLNRVITCQLQCGTDFSSQQIIFQVKVKKNQKQG